MDDDNDLDPIAAAFGIGTPTPTFKDLDISTGSLNERASTLVDPTSGELVLRKVDNVTINDLDKEERLEDLHIDAQMEGIHNAALEAFHAQHRMSQEVDPKFSARNSEVAAQYLKIALDAVANRVDAKYKRQKVRIAKSDVGTPNTVNNNIIVTADRNAVLQALLGNKEKLINEDDEK
jgi:hypothetical protein